MSDGDNVIEAGKTRLESITVVNGYTLDVGYVERQFAWPDEIGQRFPALLIIPGGVVPLEKGMQSYNQPVDRRISVFCYVFEQHNPSSALENLQAEVLKAFFSEPACLGGAVSDIRWVGADSSASAFSVVGFNVGFLPPIGVARMDFIFRHNQNLVGGA
jgi:hypothetical protein